MSSKLDNIHPCVLQIKDVLEKNNTWYDYLEHEPVRTSEEAAEIRPKHYTIKQGAKALVVRVRKFGGEKYFSMLIVPGDLKFDINKVKALLDAKDIRFATEAEVLEITDGIKVGGVPPFGNLFGLEIYADKKVFENDTIIFNAGDKRVSIAIKTSDYKTLVDPQIVDIT